MIPTPLGAVVVLIGIWLLFRPAAEMMGFVIFCSLFAGASALDAVALGHSSIPPNELALGFLLVRLCRRDFRRSPSLPAAFRLNTWLLVFCAYGAVSAFILPKIFAGRVFVMSMQHAKVISSLEPSSQNITQALYLLGTGAVAVAGSAVVTKPGATNTLIRAVLVTTWVHILTGIADGVASAVHITGLFDVLRNGAYAQLDQEVSSYHRIAGMTPEPSAYAGLGIVFLIFNTELWLRGINDRLTGLTALSMAFLLLASTSSTAYGFLAAYAVLLVARSMLAPGVLGWKKMGLLVCVCALATLISLALVLLSPRLSSSMIDVLQTMTVNKGQSLSGLERGMWARQGWNLFEQTRGLGVGVGSFRSSNIFTAILGSVGPACLVVLLVYLLQVLKPGRLSTIGAARGLEQCVGAAAAWVPVLLLIPAAFSAPSADPGILFALFAGCALALRSSAVPQIAQASLARVSWAHRGDLDAESRSERQTGFDGVEVDPRARLVPPLR